MGVGSCSGSGIVFPYQLLFICTGFCILESKTPLKLILDGFVSDQFYLKGKKSSISAHQTLNIDFHAGSLFVDLHIGMAPFLDTDTNYMKL